MIHILGVLLKIIGWILLGILGLILGILLLVLFSAIRYKVEGKKQGQDLEGQVKVTWLLWILSVLVTYKEGLLIRIKLFGLTVRKLEMGKIGADKKAGETIAETVEMAVSEKAEDRPSLAAEDKKRKKEKDLLQESAPFKEDGGEGEEGEDQKGGLIGFIHSLWDRLCALFQKLLSSIQAVDDKLEAVREKLGELLEKAEKVRTFIQDPANQRSAKLIFRQVKKVLRHLLPRKGKASVTFGLEDPYQMGQVLSAAAFLYPFTHDILTLQPVFNEKILEGEVSIKGHIRLGTLLGHVLRLFLDKNIRRQLWRLIRKGRKKGSRRKGEDLKEKAA